MPTPTHVAVASMEDLRVESEAFLNRTIVTQDAIVCNECSVESTKTSKGLVITRLAEVMMLDAQLTPIDPTFGEDVSFKVTWQRGVSELPQVGMYLHDGEEIILRKLTLRDYPWIATILSDLIEKPHLKIVR